VQFCALLQFAFFSGSLRINDESAERRANGNAERFINDTNRDFAQVYQIDIKEMSQTGLEGADWSSAVTLP